MKVERIALSGASGLIGSELHRRLTAEGRQVQAMVRDGARQQLPTDAIPWSPEDGLKHPAQLNSVDCVIHLAGRSVAAARWSATEKKRIRDSRVAATEVLVDQICNLASPPPVFLCASAIGIYGDQGDREVDESCRASTDFLAEVARDWEQACTALHSVGVRVLHLRFGMVLSKSGGALAKMLPAFRLRLGGKLGAGTQYWSWIALSDCVAAIEWLLEHEQASGAFNLVAPTALTNAEFTRQLASALQVSACLPAPTFGLRLALGEMADSLLLSSCRAKPQKLLATGFEFEFPDLPSFLAKELAA